jgi:hypothetical protein
MKQNPFFVRRIILIFLLCLVSSSIMAQKVNLYTLDIDQPNRDMHKAVNMRKAGMIITLGGVGIGVTGSIIGAILMNKDDPKNPYLGLGGAVILMLGVTVGLATTVVGIPIWIIGGKRINKAALALKTFNIAPENSLALGLGITLRF